MNDIELKLSLFNSSIIFIHFTYLAVFFGILYINQTYIRYFSTFIQLVVSIFLIVRFFPWRKTHEITKLDVSIIFYCATFLLMNVVLVEIYNMFQNTITGVEDVYKKL